jgi:hypothetical protein
LAILIFAVGAGISLYEGIHHLTHPRALENPMLNYIVLALALLFEGAAWALALREFSRSKGKWGYVAAVRRGKNPSLFVVLFEDWPRSSSDSSWGAPPRGSLTRPKVF